MLLGKTIVITRISSGVGARVGELAQALGAGFRNVGLQQDASLQKPPRRTLALVDHRFERPALVPAQPHGIPRYRGLPAAIISSIAPIAMDYESLNPLEIVEASH